MLMTHTQDHGGKALEDFLTIEEAAALSGYSGQYLRRMAKRGRLGAVKRGYFWLVERAALEAYMRAADQAGDRRYGPRHLDG